MLANNDDHDIKIFEKRSPLYDDDNFAEEFEIERKNGNLERARELGAIIANEIINLDPDSEFYFCDINVDIGWRDNLYLQSRLLMAFAVEIGLTKHISSAILSFTALNSYYDRIKEEMPFFYDSIIGDRAFSFYYLAMRCGDNLDLSISETFAMLCGNADNKDYERLGDALFYRFSAAVEKLCSDIGFVDIYALGIK